MAKKILVVDDESDLRLVTLFRLNHLGYEAFGAADGPQAIDAALKKAPDLMILDVFLPGMNGDEVAKKLKQDERSKKIPIILISADVKYLKEAVELCGADGYLTKPFNSTELTALIKKYIG